MPGSPITRAHPYTPKAGKFSRETFYSERQYRNALARSRGYKSLYAQQRHAIPVRSRAAYQSLTDVERHERDVALHVLSDMRRAGTSLSATAESWGIPPSKVQRYVGTELLKERGRYRPNASDRLFRVMPLLDEKGKFWIEVYGSRASSTIGAYWAAVERYRNAGDDRPLRRFRRMTVRTGKKTYRFLTDTKTIDRLASFGELSFESIYES